MPVDHSDSVHWDKVASELRAAREAQQRTWGDIDNTALGRYLADEASSTERAAIETAFETLPELKLLTDLVRDVLADSGTAAPVTPVTVAAPVSAPTLPFRPPAPFVQKTRWSTVRQRGAILAAACLVLALGTWMLRPDRTVPTLPRGVTSLGDAQANANRTGDGDRKTLPSGTPAATDLAFARISELKNTIEEFNTEQKGDLQNALAAAEAYTAAADNKELENNRRFAPKVAAGWNQVGLLYHNEGDINRAERALTRANDINRKTLGENDEATKQTCYHLATIYQDAVARRSEDAATGTPDRHPLMATSLPQAAKDKGRAVRDASLAEFRKRMNTEEMQTQVRNSVLPVLVKALHDAPTAPERARLAVALGNLGPLAQPAVQDVVTCLEHARDSRERLALVHALNRMGPPCSQSVPVLVQTFKQCEATDVRRSVAFYLSQAPAGIVQLDELAAKGKAEEQKCAREALQRPRGGR